MGNIILLVNLDVFVKLKSLIFINYKDHRVDLFEKLLKDRGPLGKHSHRDEEGYYMFPKLEGDKQNSQTSSLLP